MSESKEDLEWMRDYIEGYIMSSLREAYEMGGRLYLLERYPEMTGKMLSSFPEVLDNQMKEREFYQKYQQEIGCIKRFNPILEIARDELHNRKMAQKQLAVNKAVQFFYDGTKKDITEEPGTVLLALAADVAGDFLYPDGFNRDVFYCTEKRIALAKYFLSLPESQMSEEEMAENLTKKTEYAEYRTGSHIVIFDGKNLSCWSVEKVCTERPWKIIGCYYSERIKIVEMTQYGQVIELEGMN